jgi:hypothetical protein
MIPTVQRAPTLACPVIVFSTLCSIIEPNIRKAPMIIRIIDKNLFMDMPPKT